MLNKLEKHMQFRCLLYLAYFTEECEFKLWFETVTAIEQFKSTLMLTLSNVKLSSIN